jgi:hypothetical protein
VSYEIQTPAYQPSSENQAAGLRNALAFGYRVYCHGQPPPFVVRCDGRCFYRIGAAGRWRPERPLLRQADC